MYRGLIRLALVVVVVGAGVRVMGLEWSDLIFVAGALAFVFRDELRSKYADHATRDLHERVRAIEIRWESAAEMHHIETVVARLNEIEALLKKRPGAKR